VSSKYCTGNKVDVPSHAAGVNIGESMHTKPCSSKKPRRAEMTASRMRRIAH